MSDNKGKKGFWSTLFAPKKQSSCCCGSQIGIASENVKPVAAATCGKMVIKVLGTGCSSCKTLYATVQEAVNELGIDAEVVKEEDINKIMAYNVMTLPALVFNEKVVAKGRKLTVEQVKELIV